MSHACCIDAGSGRPLRGSGRHANTLSPWSPACGYTVRPLSVHQDPLPTHATIHGVDERVRQTYLRVCHHLHRVTTLVCLTLLVLLLASQLSVVILRYCFGTGFLELQDFTAYVFASLVTLSIPIALVMDRHVRVDVWREHQSPRLRRTLDSLATLLLLLPVYLLSMYLVFPDITYAWQIREGSLETGGLPGLYLIKTLFPVSCLLMVLQGAASLMKEPSR